VSLICCIVGTLREATGLSWCNVLKVASLVFVLVSKALGLGGIVGLDGGGSMICSGGHEFWVI
jgi:hypothetical protein